MKLDIEQYEIIAKVLVDTNLKFVFQNIFDKKDKKVLNLEEVTGFIDTIDTRKIIKVLRIDAEGGSYNLDLSIKLKRPEIKKFPEVFLFVDSACVNFCFKAVAKFIELRDWEEKDEWLY